jgi:putrescine importer
MSQELQQLHKFGYKQELTRAFGLWHLTAYGLNYMIPIAPAIVFGFVLQASGGTVALPYLFALCGTLFTAFGYAYFIKRYPLAGSVYSYVSKSIGDQIGFLSGWAILLDYMVIPSLTAMSASSFLHDLMSPSGI